MSLSDMSIIILLIFALFDVARNTRRELLLSRTACVFLLVALFALNRLKFSPTPEFTLNAVVPYACFIGFVVHRRGSANIAKTKNSFLSQFRIATAVMLCTVASASVMFLLDSSEIAVIVSSAAFALLILTNIEISKLIIIMVTMPLVSEILKFIMEVIFDGYGFLVFADGICDVMLLSILLTLIVHEIFLHNATKKLKTSPEKTIEKV